MASQRTTADLIVELAGGTVSARTMFGEFGLFHAGKMIAVVCDDQLFVKPSAAGRAYLGTVTEARPYPQAKPYLLIDGERWEEEGLLMHLFAITAMDMPAPKPKKARRKASS